MMYRVGSRACKLARAAQSNREVQQTDKCAVARKAKKQQVSQWRAYSTDSSSQQQQTEPEPAPKPKKVPLRIALKKFYLLVHPDLFGGKAEMQKVNDNSFKSLMEYLELYKSDGDEDNSSANKQYSLKFYVKETVNGEETFRTISAKLTLPLNGSGTEARQAHLLANISPLLRDCGYTHELDVTGYGERKGRNGGAPEIPLLKMLLALTTQLHASKTSPAAKKFAQQKAAKQQEFDAVLAKLKSAHKGGSFATEFPHHAFSSPVDRLHALTNAASSLHQVFTTLPPQVVEQLKTRPITFTHKKKGLHPKGHIYIDITSDASDHSYVLHSATEENKLQGIQELDKKRVGLESAIRSALDLASLSAEHNAAYTESYIAMLEELARDIPQRDRMWRLPESARGKLHVRFVSGVASGNPVDPGSSSLTVPVDTTVEHVREFIQANAVDTVKSFSKLERAVKAVAGELSVRSLTYQPGLDFDNLVTCLERLGAAAEVCRPFMNGLSVCIADQYGVNEEAKTVFLKWDFKL